MTEWNATTLFRHLHGTLEEAHWTLWYNTYRRFTRTSGFHSDYTHGEHDETRPTVARPTVARPTTTATVMVFLYQPNCEVCRPIHEWVNDLKGVGKMNMQLPDNDIFLFLWALTHLPRFLVIEDGKWSVRTWDETKAWLETRSSWETRSSVGAGAVGVETQTSGRSTNSVSTRKSRGMEAFEYRRLCLDPNRATPDRHRPTRLR